MSRERWKRDNDDVERRELKKSNNNDNDLILIELLISIYIICQDPRPGLDRFFPLASLDKKSVVKRLTKSSQKLDCLSYYLMFHDRNTIFFLYEIASRDEQS